MCVCVRPSEVFHFFKNHIVHKPRWHVYHYTHTHMRTHTNVWWDFWNGKDFIYLTNFKEFLPQEFFLKCFNQSGRSASPALWSELKYLGSHCDCVARLEITARQPWSPEDTATIRSARFSFVVQMWSLLTTIGRDCYDILQRYPPSGSPELLQGILSYFCQD